MRLPDSYRFAATNANVMQTTECKDPIQEVNGQVEYTSKIRGKAPVFGSK
jgi:hypothetical protein